MNGMYAFHETARGYLHLTNEIPCEDSSASFLAENGSFLTVAVADGHGAKSCFRSSIGSKTAVDVSQECLRQFAEMILTSEETENRFYGDIFSDSHYCQTTIRRLTDAIVAEWYDRVMEDYKDNPPSPEEMGENAAEYESGRNPAHIYGTTLIAALWLPKCLILLQQGDGRCDVFYADGSVRQPIPWDSRCEDTTTTSLCDEDAPESFRSCVIDLSDQPVMACCLGCDGVEDAYRDSYGELGGTHVFMGGVHSFYKDLLCQLTAMDHGEFEKYLRAMLPEFSKSGKFSKCGSGDDVSVAGIVDENLIAAFIPQFQTDVRLYDLEEKLFWKEDELRGKTRKHKILQDRMLDAQEKLEELLKTQESSALKISQLKEERAEVLKRADEARIEMETYQEESQSAMERIGGRYVKIMPIVKLFFERLTDGCSEQEKECCRIENELTEIDGRIAHEKEIYNELEEAVLKQQEKLNGAKLAFEEYDLKYREIESQKKAIENEIASFA